MKAQAANFSWEYEFPMQSSAILNSSKRAMQSGKKINLWSPVPRVACDFLTVSNMADFEQLLS